MISSWHRDIIVGTILGGSSLTKPPKGINYYLSMRSCNPLWLTYKTQELEKYFSGVNLIKDGTTYRCNSHCSEDFTYLHDIMYQEQKRVLTEKILYPMMDIGLAIWFLDGGGKTGREKKNLYLNTTKIGKEGTDLAVTYFNEMDLKCKPTISNNRIRILFSVKGSLGFMKIIAHRIPEFMWNKI